MEGLALFPFLLISILGNDLFKGLGDEMLFSELRNIPADFSFLGTPILC